MNIAFLETVIIILCSVVLLNLWVTFRLIKKVKYLRLTPVNNLPSLHEGDQMPEITGNLLIDGSVESSINWSPVATVLVFLSSSCDKCKSKIPQIEQVLNNAASVGLEIKLLTFEKARKVRRFLKGARLQHHTVIVSDSLYRVFNPDEASPFYMFIDHEHLVQAKGMIGDENWEAFVDQVLHEIDDKEVA